MRHGHASRSSLLSLDRGHPSMHKIVSLGRKKTLGAGTAFLKGGEEFLQLAFRQCVEEGLEENHSLSQTSIQIVVRGIEDIPIAVGVKGVACQDFLRGGQKVGGELLDEFGQRGDFVEELGPPGRSTLLNTLLKRATRWLREF